MTRKLHKSKSKATSTELRDFIVESLEDGKAVEIVTIDLNGKTDIADYMVIASGTSDRHVSSLGTNIVTKLKKHHKIDTKIEGVASGNWVLLDASDVIVHIFKPDIRKLYDLESMWLTPLFNKKSS